MGQPPGIRHIAPRMVESGRRSRWSGYPPPPPAPRPQAEL